MAFFDDNNSGLPTGTGKDPLEELDKELEQLRLSLGELEQDEPDEPNEPQIPDEPRRTDAPRTQAAPQQAPAVQQSSPAPQSAVRRKPAPARVKQETPPAGRSSGGMRTAIIVTALILALIGVAVGLTVYFLNQRPAPEPDPVTIHDSELGTVELQPVQGASVNTYSADNLSRDVNGYYTYTVDGVKVSEMGIDLSEYQGDVDFGAVKASGIDFVMLRIGGRYYGDEGRLYSDTAFEDYYQQAKNAGLKVGVYFFSQAASKEDAVEEAQYTLSLLGGKPLDYPIAIDWETIDDDDARTDDVSGEELTAIAAAFCDTVEEAGYRSAVYASTSLILQSYNFETMKNYAFWLADYRAFPEAEKMYYNFTMWQYSTDGAVPGIEGSVDMNLCLDPNW